MLRIFPIILGMSLTGSVLFLLFLLLSPLLRRCFSAVWYRSALCVLLFFFAVPAGMIVRLIMEKLITDQTMASLPFMGEVPSPLANVIITQATGDAAIASGTLENLPMLFAYLWLCVAIVLLMRKAVSLIRFRSQISHCVRPTEDGWILLVHQQVLQELGVRKQVKLCQSSYVNTPMIVGLGHPAVVLPDIGWAQEELTLVLRHELTHYRHRDLWMKWVGAVLCALHWFNPCVWLLIRQLERWMELACDAAVVCNIDFCATRS